LVTIAYITGCGGSGTTLLARLLGEIPGFVCVGEAGAYFLGPGILAVWQSGAGAVRPWWNVPCGAG